MGDKYSADRKDPPIALCALVSLEFNGKILLLQGTKLHTYHAVSGKGNGIGDFPTDAATQHKADVGPIPEGTYWIMLSEMVENGWNHPFMSRSSWGNYRIIIHPYPSTETFGRGGMFIHGGSTPGSAGCVDLWDAMDTFVSDLNAEVGSNVDCVIPLRVHYSNNMGDYNLPPPGRAVT